MIDASSWIIGGVAVSGDGLSSGYTVVSFARTTNGAADNGLTITPNGGDTGKALFLPNSGERWIGGTNGAADRYGTEGYSWSAEQYPTNTSYVWRLGFSIGYTSGVITNGSKLNAYAIRCVRS